MKEKLIFNKNEELLKAFMEIQKDQLELDKAKVEMARHRAIVRSKAQVIPEKIRRLKI